MRASRWTPAAVAVGLLLGLPAPPAAGQQGPPLSNAVLTGNGTVSYGSVLGDGASDFRHDFRTTLAPILLYDMPGDLLFEAHLSYELEGGETNTTLEYAQVDYLGFENVQLTAGRFLLPFGLFGERYHTPWINKLPSMPLLYGHAHGGVPGRALLPVLSDVGVLGRFTGSLSRAWTLNASVWVSQGPREVTADEDGDDHAHSHASLLPDARANGTGGHDHDGGEVDVPSVAFGTNFSDNNDNKMLGARLGLVHGGSFEAYVSGFHALYDEDGFLDYFGSNLALAWRPGRFEVRGAGVLLWQEFRHEGAFETVRKPGYYLQVSRRTGSFEPVLRWSHLLEADVGGATARNDDQRLAAGLNYWLSDSSVLKPAVEINPDGREELIVQMAVGF